MEYRWKTIKPWQSALLKSRKVNLLRLLVAVLRILNITMSRTLQLWLWLPLSFTLPISPFFLMRMRSSLASLLFGSFIKLRMKFLSVHYRNFLDCLWKFLVGSSFRSLLPLISFKVMECDLCRSTEWLPVQEDPGAGKDELLKARSWMRKILSQVDCRKCISLFFVGCTCGEKYMKTYI